MLSKAETRELYRKRAGRYDLAMWVCRLAGFRLDRYRRRAIEALELRPRELYSGAIFMSVGEARAAGS